MKHILSLHYTNEFENFDYEFEFEGQEYRISQIATDFNYKLTKEIIRKYDGICDVICFSGIPSNISYKNKVFTHPQAHKIKNLAKETPVVDGSIIKDIYIPLSIRKLHLSGSSLVKNRRMGFYAGVLQKSLVDSLAEFHNELVFADPYFFFKLPMALKGKENLDHFMSGFSSIFKRIRIKRSRVSNFTKASQIPGLNDFFKSDVFIGNNATFNLIDLKHLRGKDIIVDVMTPELETRLKANGVISAIECLPRILDHTHLNFSILEALIYLQKDSPEQLVIDDILTWFNKSNIEPKVSTFSKESKHKKERKKFAFIIHPLSASYLLKHPVLKPIKSLSKPLSKKVSEIAETAISYSPGFYYGSIEDVTSNDSGEVVDGLIYTVTETPKKMMDKDPEIIYNKLVNLAKKAKNDGAEIIGLGAYTKIVGDAGITVNRRSPIPVTTGNSLSSASTLWAANYAIDKINLVKKKGSHYQGTVMVVGATGSIGAVSAKILAMSWDKVILVAPRAYKLIELKEEILKIAPKCDIQVSTKADIHSHECDLIITTTSSQGKKIMDIENVKPGCVICDVSRPFDITLEDTLKRPDVMVIASGEVCLPGNVKINCDLGLEDNMVYACLAETALLCMEHKFESFTLSRTISYEKVIEIDAMAKKHGVTLAAIMGHQGEVTDKEFELCREHALKELTKLEANKV